MGKGLIFVKMTASGNDFILMDNRDALIDPERYSRLAQYLCQRRRSVGADGLIIIENDPEVDFRWRLFNPDGTEAEMCGNGARCSARYAVILGIVSGSQVRSRTLAGIIEAIVTEDQVKIKLPTPRRLETDLKISIEDRLLSVHHIDTGVPHAVIFTESERELTALDVVKWGKLIRNHPRFQPAGTNVDFACIKTPSCIINRTYERGVENETLACGTGAVASVLVAATLNRVGNPPIEVRTSGNDILKIWFSKAEKGFSRIYLEGDAKVVYEGRLCEDVPPV